MKGQDREHRAGMLKSLLLCGLVLMLLLAPPGPARADRPADRGQPCRCRAMFR